MTPKLSSHVASELVVMTAYKWQQSGHNDECQFNVNIQVVVLHGPLTRYVKLRVAGAPGMPGTFSPPQGVSDPDMHHGTCVTHVPWCMPRSLTSGLLWSQWSSRHSRRMHNPQFYVSGKRPMFCVITVLSSAPCNLGINSLSGEPDYFGRNKISSGGDLSHYSSASLY